MRTKCFALYLISTFLFFSILEAQKNSASCIVKQPGLEGTYKGDCKNGLANGKGEATGTERYTGMFKDGRPNGTGIYYFNDSIYYNGNFQDGIKEGKGEMHYLHTSKADSVVKGYWSGNVYKGSKYITYTFDSNELFDQTDISASKTSGNILTIEIMTTSGSPNGAPTSTNSFVLSLTNLISTSGSMIKQDSKFESAFKSYVSFEIFEFPCKLFGTLNDNRTFTLELYKAANWKVRLFKNK